MSFEKRKAVPLAAAFLIAVGIGSTATADTGVEIYSTNVTLNGGDIGLGGGDILDSGVVVWNSSQGFVPASSVETNPIQSGTTASDVGLGQVENEAQVAESGDNLTGDLNLTGNTITNVGFERVDVFSGSSDAFASTDNNAIEFGDDIDISARKLSASNVGIDAANSIALNADQAGNIETCVLEGDTGDFNCDGGAVFVGDVRVRGRITDTGAISTVTNPATSNALDIQAKSSSSQNIFASANGDVDLQANADGSDFFCTLSESDGSFTCDGSKNWRQSLNTTHNAVYSAQESPEVRAVYEGQTATSNGQVNVSLPSHFSKTVSDTRPSLRVQATPHSLAVVAVTERTDDYLVIESSKDVTVDYRVTGIREGYEDKQVVRKK